MQTRCGDRLTSTVFDDASHAHFPEQPDAVAAAIIGHLRQANGTPPASGAPSVYRL